jgi:hypothetical protein
VSGPKIKEMAGRQDIACSIDWSGLVQEPVMKKKRSMVRLPVTPSRVAHFFDDGDDVRGGNSNENGAARSDGEYEDENVPSSIHRAHSTPAFPTTNPYLVQKRSKVVTMLKIIRRPSFRGRAAEPQKHGLDNEW